MFSIKAKLIFIQENDDTVIVLVWLFVFLLIYAAMFPGLRIVPGTWEGLSIY